MSESGNTRNIMLVNKTQLIKQIILYIIPFNFDKMPMV